MEKKPEWLKVRYNQEAVTEVAAFLYAKTRKKDTDGAAGRDSGDAVIYKGESKPCTSIPKT